MRVALTGATGILGHFILTDLLARGCQVQALRRKRDANNSNLTWITGDMENQRALDTLMQGCDALVHCAFSHRPGQYRGGEGDDVVRFWQINLLGTMRLLETACAMQVERVVCLSSRAVFTGPHNTEQAIEDNHRQQPDTHYGTLKAAIEMVSGLYSRQTGPVIAQLRPTGVYGLVQPVENSKWYTLIQSVLAGKKLTAANASTEVHGQDVARAVWLLLHADREDMTEPGYNCSDLVVDTRDLVSMVRLRSGCEATLPEASAPPSAPMICNNLKALGWQPGGLVLLEKTIEKLIAAVQNNRS